MHLTHFTDYTLRVLIFLGLQHGDDRLATIHDIAGAYGISANHLMKIVHHLSRQGYVNTVRGKGGGTRLARAPGEINLGEVVRGAEPGLVAVQCLRPGDSACPIAPVCELQHMLIRATDAYLQVLDRHTLEDLIRPKARLIRSLKNAGAPR